MVLAGVEAIFASDAKELKKERKSNSSSSWKGTKKGVVPAFSKRNLVTWKKGTSECLVGSKDIFCILYNFPVVTIFIIKNVNAVDTTLNA